jgi:hypothetical protein|tara:strand:- start:463 stop:879 length:417 start_codon:yes stop_codon:yes gene_type:complete
MKTRTALIVLLTLGLFTNGCGGGSGISGDEEMVNIVRNGNFDQSHFMFGSDIDFESKTIGEGFEAFFGSPKWKGFVATDGNKIVEFSGDATFADKKVVVEFQFKMNAEDNSFEVGYFGMDGESAPQIMGEGLIDKIFK